MAWIEAIQQEEFWETHLKISGGEFLRVTNWALMSLLMTRAVAPDGIVTVSGKPAGGAQCKLLLQEALGTVPLRTFAEYNEGMRSFLLNSAQKQRVIVHRLCLRQRRQMDEEAARARGMTLDGQRVFEKWKGKRKFDRAVWNLNWKQKVALANRGESEPTSLHLPQAQP